MNDDDLLAPKLSAPPSTSPIARGAAAAVVTAALVVTGCNAIGRRAPEDAGNPGIAVVDAGISVPPDATAP